jgi:hypothetical protein
MWESEAILARSLSAWRAIHVNTFTPRKVKWEYTSGYMRSIAPTYPILENVIKCTWIDPEYTTISSLLRFLKWETGVWTLDKERKFLYDILHNESNWLPKEKSLWDYKSKWRKYRGIRNRTIEHDAL